MIEVKGASHIVARIILDSITPDGVRLTTFELEYPRFIHSEFMTHRMLSKNAASSRAIPAKRMREHISEVPQAPVSWGKNQAGMSAKEDLSGIALEGIKRLWDAARDSALSFHKVMEQTGAHKQIVNRVTEPFMQMKVVCSGTEWSNFLWLRKHKDADPTIHELARCISECLEESTPQLLATGSWHLPYVSRYVDENGEEKFTDASDVEMPLDTAVKVSASCCAQVSYRVLDDSIDKAIAIYDKLINSVPVHASPVEHQAMSHPLYEGQAYCEWPAGITHKKPGGELWSGNFRGWVQHRQLLENHTKW